MEILHIGSFLRYNAKTALAGWNLKWSQRRWNYNWCKYFLRFSFKPKPTSNNLIEIISLPFTSAVSLSPFSHDVTDAAFLCSSKHLHCLWAGERGGGCDGKQALHLGVCVADVGGSKMSSGNGTEEEQRKTPICYSHRKYSVRVGGRRGGGMNWPPWFCEKILLNHPSE